MAPIPGGINTTAPPMLSYPRFDLADSSYPIMMMADQTPAWREVVHAYSWMSWRHATLPTGQRLTGIPLSAPAPIARKLRPLSNAPGAQAWPERVRGNYDSPGWTANGVEPWGLQPDPIGADGNLFFRGWLNLLLDYLQIRLGR